MMLDLLLEEGNCIERVKEVVLLFGGVDFSQQRSFGLGACGRW
jgi:hypothetical protein